SRFYGGQRRASDLQEPEQYARETLPPGEPQARGLESAHAAGIVRLSGEGRGGGRVARRPQADRHHLRVAVVLRADLEEPVVFRRPRVVGPLQVESDRGGLLRRRKDAAAGGRAAGSTLLAPAVGAARRTRGGSRKKLAVRRGRASDTRRQAV